MPRVYDRHPGQRGAGSSSLYNPTRSGLAYQDPMSAIDGTAAAAGDLVRGNLALIIKELTGIDLTGAFEFVDWLGEQIGLVLHGFGELWQQLLDGIVGVWQKAVDIVGSTVQNVIDAIAGIFGVGENAALAADKANIGVQALKAQQAGGGFDEFNYPNSARLPTDLYDVVENGPGGGSYGPNGSGFLVWKGSGSAWREVVYRRKIVLGSDNGVVTAVWSTRPKDPLFADAYGYIDGRVANDNSNNRVRARIDNNTAIIQAVVGGTAHQIGGGASLNIKNGDVFELWYGTGAKPRRFWLKQNGVTVHDVEDLDEISQLGADYRSVGVGGRVDTYGILIALSQNPMPALAGITWATHTIA